MDLEMSTRPGRGEMRWRLPALAGLVAVMIAGCGGSSTPSTNATNKAASGKTTAPKPLSTTATMPSSSAASTANGSSSSSNAPSFASAGNCTDMAGVGAQFAKAMEAAGSGGKYNLSAAVAAYKHLADAAPSAIRPDLETLASAFSTYATTIGKAGFKPGVVPSATQIAAIEAASKQFSSAKLLAASKAIESWAAKNCTA